MRWFSRLRGTSRDLKGKSARVEIPTVKAHPDRPGLVPPAPPRRRGKTQQELDAELAAYHLAMRKHFAEIAAFNRKRCMALGITSYTWLPADVHNACEVAKRNGGKTFLYDQPPPEGHVGEGACTSPDWCRCIAKPIVPGFS